MTPPPAHSLTWTATRPSFDSIVEQVRSARTSFEEEELLRESHWCLGQDARLREDVRFRQTPWGRWMPATAYLANEALFTQLHREPQSRPEIEQALADLDSVVKRHCVFCKGDPRFVLEGGTVRLSARELTSQPLVESEVGELEKYVTHLPVHSLRAAAASLPAGEWRKSPQEHMIETLGWVRVSLGRKLNARMFVARIEGKSMDDGRSGLVDGGYAVFELWPSGSRKQLNVLVRGAFADPETGSYAVKKYMADERDEERRHRRVTLVSLNPDKERYPDIELDVEEDDDVTVVAKVVQPLSPDQFARRPRAVRRPGRRNLSSSESIAEIASDQQARTGQFFEALPSDDEVDVETERSNWSAQLVCLEAVAGGLHVEAGPLVGLWSFVKQLRVRGESWQGSTLASNARLRPVRIPLPAASGPWRWEAVGFEDDPDIDFSNLDLAPLAEDAPVAFRVDASGVGRLLASRTLSEGQTYRLLFSNRVLARLGSKPPASALALGWHLWEVDLGSPITPENHSLLRDLGFEIGEQAARLEWVLVPPGQWRTSPRGTPYPCFLADPAPVLAVSGPEVDVDGAASIFLCEPGGHHELSLPAGGKHFIQLQGLLPGRYSAMLLFDRTSVAPERVYFEIVEALPRPAAARWEIQIGGETVSPSPGTATVMPAQDLSDPTGGTPLPFRVTAPPGWPVRVSWKELGEDLVLSTNAEPDGRIDTDKILSATRDRRARRPIADLIVDLAELGAVVLRHERRPTPDTLRNRIEELVTARGATTQRLAGSYVELLPIWFEPVCSIIGYDIAPIAVKEEIEPPQHVAAYRLLHTERLGTAIERRPARVLLLVEDLSRPLADALLSWLDNLCVREGLRDVLVSDGLRWAGHRRAARLAPRVWDLAVAANDPEEFVDFLRLASEGV